MADVLTGPLHRYLHQAAAMPWAWGESDCFLFAADWVLQATGIDPAGAYRGAYTTQREARRLMRSCGGPLALAAVCMARAGGRPVCVSQAAHGRAGDVVRAGDVGLVKVAILQRRGRPVFAPVGAICLRPDLWAIRRAEARGIACAPFPLLAAWRLPPAAARPGLNAGVS